MPSPLCCTGKDSPARYSACDSLLGMERKRVG